jgi:hypothetical protein
MRRAEVLLPFRQSPFVTEILGVVPDPGGKIERGRFCQVGICFADHRQTFASLWGEGTTSSSDGQRFQAAGRGEEAGQVNLRYGTETWRAVLRARIRPARNPSTSR